MGVSTPSTILEEDGSRSTVLEEDGGKYTVLEKDGGKHSMRKQGLARIGLKSRPLYRSPEMVVFQREDKS